VNQDFDYDAYVADWPPLTPEQRDRLAVLLRGPSVRSDVPHPIPPKAALSERVSAKVRVLSESTNKETNT
jgi:hypothetical protein